MSLPSARRSQPNTARSNGPDTARIKPFLAFQERPDTPDKPIKQSVKQSTTQSNNQSIKQLFTQSSCGDSIQLQDQIASINQYHAKELRAKQRMIEALKTERDKAINQSSDHYRNRRLNILDRELTESRTVFNTLIDYIQRRNLISPHDLAAVIDSINQSSNVVDPVNHPKLQLELSKAKQRADELQILVDKYKYQSVKSNHQISTEQTHSTSFVHSDPDEKTERMKASLPKLVIGSSNDIAHQQSINQLHSIIAQLQQSISQLNEQLSERDAQIDQLNDELLNNHSNLIAQSDSFEQSLKQMQHEHHLAIQAIHDQQTIKRTVDQEYFCQEVRQFKIRVQSIIESKSELEHQLEVARSNESRLLEHISTLQQNMDLLKRSESSTSSLNLKQIIADQSVTVGILTANSAAGGEWMLQSCQQRINELELLLADHQQRDAHYRTDRQLFDQSNQRFTQIQSEHSQQEHMIESLNQTISQLQQHLAESNQRTTDAQSKSDEQDAEISRSKKHNKELITQIARYQAAILIVDEEQRELDAAREELRCEREEQVLREKEVLLSNRAAKLAQATAEAKLIEYRKEVDHANARVSAVQVENAVLIQTMSQLNSSIVTKQQQSELLVEKQARESQREVEQRIRIELTAEFERDESVLRDKEELIRLLQRENYELEGRISSQSRKIVELADQVEQLEEQLAARSTLLTISPQNELSQEPPVSQELSATSDSPLVSADSTQHLNDVHSPEMQPEPTSHFEQSSVSDQTQPQPTFPLEQSPPIEQTQSQNHIGHTAQLEADVDHSPDPADNFTEHSVDLPHETQLDEHDDKSDEHNEPSSQNMSIAQAPEETHVVRSSPAQLRPHNRVSLLDSPVGVRVDGSERDRAHFFSAEMQLSASGYRPEHGGVGEIPSHLIINSTSAPPSPTLFTVEQSPPIHTQAASAEKESSVDTTDITQSRPSIYPEDRRAFVELALEADAALDRELQIPNFVLPPMSP